jgi:S-methyl-5-thioribose-1-phosphate isomerase
MTADNLQSLRYTNDGSPSLSVLDQLKVPMEKVYIEVGGVEAAWSVIRSMQIRGAPLIAIVAVLGLAVDLNANEKTVDELDAMDANDKDSLLEYIQKKMDYLATARPTAVNVFNALDEVKNVLSSQSNRADMCQAVVAHAEFMLQRDVSDNKAIGKFGADAILNKHSPGSKARIVTICNTGSLATAGYGTALGVVRALAEQDRLESITALETRPYNQGSRLTAFEILEENMPGGTLICDSMAASFIKVCGLCIVVCIFCLFFNS